MFPGNNFSDMTTFVEYLSNNADETPEGKFIRDLYDERFITLSEDTLEDDFKLIYENVQGLYDGYN
jgi:hypothetical protein